MGTGNCSSSRYKRHKKYYPDVYNPYIPYDPEEEKRSEEKAQQERDERWNALQESIKRRREEKKRVKQNQKEEVKRKKQLKREAKDKKREEKALKEEAKEKKQIEAKEKKKQKESSSIGFFAAKTVKPIAEDIPDEFCCSITHELMQRPVFCTLDGRSYEETAIREWLTKCRTSPYNRKKMAEGQSCDDVLVRNYNLEDAISKYSQNIICVSVRL